MSDSSLVSGQLAKLGKPESHGGGPELHGHGNSFGESPVIHSKIAIPGGEHQDPMAGLFGNEQDLLGPISENAALGDLDLGKAAGHLGPFPNVEKGQLADMQGLEQQIGAGNLTLPTQGNVAHTSVGMGGQGGGH